MLLVINMKKITELTYVKQRTIHYRDDYGVLIKGSEEYLAYRPVNIISNGPKFAHFVVDLICFQFLVVFIGVFGQVPLGLMHDGSLVSDIYIAAVNIVTFCLYPALYTFCEYKWQKTPGKYLTKSIVIDEYANKPELRTLVLRSIIRIIPLEPFSCLGVPSSGWHDRWSNTYVVSLEELLEIKRLQLEQTE